MDVELRWLDRTAPDPGDLAYAVALAEAARLVDAPHWPPLTTGIYADNVRYGWDDDPNRYALAVHDGEPVAVFQLELPRWDNLHVAGVNVVVDPNRRRQGFGRQLAAVGAELARDAGRQLLLMDSNDGPAAAALAASEGFACASVEVQRRLDVRGVDRGWLREEHAKAQAAAADYELVRILGHTPAGLVDAVAVLTGAINDAPLDDLEIEDEVFTAERVRAFESTQAARGRRLYRLLARHRETGELGGVTVLFVDREQPWHGWQADTSVARPHRGHRLGMLLKTDMLAWLAEPGAEPQLRVIDTSNAATNDHMIAINEALGFRPIARDVVWQRHL